MYRFLLTFCGVASLLSAQQSADRNVPSKKAEQFKNFTGKILANKVRIRAKPDLDSHIVRQLNKGDLILIVADAGDFWAIQPPKGTKAYVFRSYVLDNTVEANQVNVRLEPHVDAPIIAQLQAGEKIEGSICQVNQKWLEITPPKNTHFFISKEFVANSGGPEFLISMEQRKTQAEELLNSALFLAEAECKKPYEEISLHPAMDQFQTIIRSYPDFPETVERAKEALSLVKDAYLQKKISFLEARADLSPEDKKALLTKHREEVPMEESSASSSLSRLKVEPSTLDRGNFWDTIEESLYLSWSAFHTEKSLSDFYQEQKANAMILSGTVECYDQPVRNRPGDYILRGAHAPVAYLYSTMVNLDKYLGKKVTIMATPRPNNHFAFPAYFVLSVD